MTTSPNASSPPTPAAPARPPGPITANRRRIVGLCLLLLTTPLIVGCATSVGFSAPIAGDAEPEVDVTPFVGSWTVQPDAGITLELTAAGPNTMQGIAIQPGWEADSPPVTFAVDVTTVEGRTFASIHSDDAEFRPFGPAWIVGAIESNDNGLVFRGLPEPVIEAAIAAGDLAAKRRGPAVDEDAGGGPVFELTGAALRAYVSAHPEAFYETESVVLRRSVAAVAAGEGRSVRSDAPDRAYLPTAAVASEDLQPIQPPTQYAPDAGYPGGPAYEAWPSPSYYLGQGSMRGMATPFAPPVPAGPAGSDGAPAPGAGLPGPVKGIVLAFALLAVFGVATAAGLDYLKRRATIDARRAAAAGGDNGDGTALMTHGNARTANGAASPDGFLAALRRNAWPALLVLAVAVGPLLYVAVLLGGLGFPGWSLLAPATQSMLHDNAPYVLVFSIGAVLAVAEVATSFPAFAVEALGTKWAALLVLFNALGTVIVYSAVVTYAVRVDHPLLRALAIAIGFAVLIRTRFVLARGLGRDEAGEAGKARSAGAAGAAGAAGDGISVDLGWPYARIQRMCAQRIDRDLLRDGRYATARLLALFPDTAALEQVAVDSIRRRDPSEADGLLARLDAIRGEDVGAGIVRARIARFAVETGGVENTRFVVEHGGEGEDRLR